VGLFGFPTICLAGIPVIREVSPQKLVFEISFDSPKIDTLWLNGEPHLSVTFPGSNFGGKVGYPSMPYFSFPLAVPIGGKATLSSYQVLRSSTLKTRLMPVPGPTFEIKNGIPQTHLIYDHDFLSAPTSQPARPYEIHSKGMVLTLPMASLHLYPLTFNGKTRVWNFHQKIRVTLTFSAPGELRSGIHPRNLNPSLKKDLLNGSNLRQWTSVPRPLAKRKTLAAETELDNFWASNLKFRIVVGGNDELDLANEGVKVISFDALKELGNLPNSIPLDQVRLYSGGGYELNREKRRADETSPAVDSQFFREWPVLIRDHGAQGNFDSGDSILFYGRTTTFWTHNKSGVPYYYINRYTFDHVYWLTLDGYYGVGNSPKRIVVASKSLWPPAILRTSFPFRFHLENNRVGQLNNNSHPTDPVGIDFFWTYIKENRSTTFRVDYQFPLLADDKSGEIEAHFLGLLSSFRIDGKQIKTRVTPGEVLPVPAFKTSGHFEMGELSLGAFVDFLEGFYNKKLVAEGDQITVWDYPSPIGLGGDSLAPVNKFNISGFSNPDLVLWDVTDPFQDSSDLTPLVNSTGSANFSASFSSQVKQGFHGRYLAAGRSTWKKPDSIELVVSPSEDVLEITNSQVRGLINPALGVMLPQMDYLIIYHPSFLNEAIRLCNHRMEYKGDEVENPVMVNVFTLYNLYSGGQMDPTAIRNFLRDIHVHNNLSAKGPLLKFVILFGDGHFNYKAYLSTPEAMPNFIPPFESSRKDLKALRDRYPSGSDAFFGDVDTAAGSGYNFFIGRLPSENLEEANNMVEKIINFDTSHSDFGRHNIHTFVADDAWQQGEKDKVSNHVKDMEGVIRTMKKYQNNSHEYQRIYLFDYPFDGFDKPKAAEAILGAANRGTLTLSFVGHGGSTQWSDEKIMGGETASQFKNENKYFISYTASCSIGEFDLMPPHKGLGEIFLKLRRKAAVANISGVRLTFAPPI